MAMTLPLPLAPVSAEGQKAQLVEAAGSGRSDSALDALWARVLASLASDPAITRASFATWLKGTRLTARVGGRFIVAAQHGFARDKLHRSFAEPVRRALLREIGDLALEVEFIVPGAPRLGDAGKASSIAGVSDLAPPSVLREATPGPVSGDTPSTPLVAATVSLAVAKPLLNPRYTFTSFVAGKEAQFAYAAARAVAENPVLSYNPLYLYGPAGLGKTHLLHALGNSVLALRPAARVAYLQTRRLVEELEREMGRSQRAALLSAYASVDVLLLDDVHEVAGQPAQKDVLHLLDALIEAGNQVVASADRAARAIEGLDERLRSCLQMGLVADIAAPGAETRLAILRAKAEARGASLPPAALDYVSRRAGGSVRELEGALTRVIAAAELSRGPLTLDGVAAALSSAVGGAPIAGRRVRPAPQHVLRAVALTFGVPEAALLEKRRDKEVVLPRHVAMLLMRELTGSSLSEIGAALGGRDHTTVMHGCEKIVAAAAADERLRGHMEAARHLAAEVAAAGGAAAP